ncbi:MAG: glutamate-5-semialdehyde dehydrogenase [Clostridia bacterium]|nr:glutamate-5-semialdehyde dehydrogenase [Clostridia bacterium]
MLTEIGKRVKNASVEIATASTDDKNRILKAIATALRENCDEILKANAIDLQNGRNNGMSEALLDRLMLNEDRVEGMAQGIEGVISLPDPVGRVLWETERPNGLKIQRVSSPLGVIGIIYEARPNVTSDVAALAIKSGNTAILRGGKEAFNSNSAIMDIMRNAVEKSGFNPDIIELVRDTSRESSTALMRMNGFVDVLIPRGSAKLINAVVQNSTVPVIETGAGNCHIYVDEFADIDMAAEIVFNAKTQRISVCNTAESLLIHKNIAEFALIAIKAKLDEKNVILYGDEVACEICPDIEKATEEDWATEYLDYKMSVKIVSSLEEATEHIRKYSTGHSESIITENIENAEKFMNTVDSSAVYHNASTRFTDGGEFGFGAEIGISTQKLHARGPLGLPQLNSFKYKIYGNGQVR